MKVNRRGVLVLVSTFVVSLAVLRGALLALFGEPVGVRAPLWWDVATALVVALLACRARVVLDEGERSDD